MNNNNTKIKVLHLGHNIRKQQNTHKNSKKQLIESYNTKSYNKLENYLVKKIYLEKSPSSEKKNKLSLFSFFNSSTNKEEKIANKSLRTTRETESNQINNNNNQKFSKNKIKI